MPVMARPTISVCMLDWIAVGTFAGLAGELADLGGGRRDEETAQDPFLR
jgi:hypothetical protein